jgi:protein tyrosine/serine phosphatase
LAHKGLLNGNVHTVVPGSVYRSAQLNPRQLQRVIARYGVRTVISLRGGDEGDDWFCEQGVACGAEGAGLEGITFSARRLPHPGKLKKLLRAFDRSPYPLLFHCRGGADRTGMAATLYLHLYAGVPLDEAQRRGLTWRYGHFPFQAAPMGEFFDLYRAEANGLPLREWIREEYPRVFQQHRNIDEPGVG